MTALMERIRYQPEQTLIQELFERYDLAELIAHHEAEAGAAAHEYVLGTQLRLTPILAPRLVGLLQEVKERLDFDEDTELFVQADASVNAFAIHTLAEGLPHMVSMTSGLVELMSDDELRFVLGHELGHLYYRHYRARLIYAAVGKTEVGESRLPLLLQRRMESWERLAELSADRSGFTAVDGKLEPIVSAFFKMASGLGPEHLSFDIGEFLAQLEDLKKLKRREVLAQFSHPVTPVRVRALQLYGEAGGSAAEPDVLTTVDDSVAEIAQLMEHEVSEPLEVNGRDFLLSAGILAAHADGTQVSKEEWDLLVHLLLPLCADPEASLAQILSAEQAHELMDTSSEWLRENAGAERYTLYQQLAHLVAVDGRILGHEKEFMLEIAERLRIPEKSAMNILYEVLAGYLQTSAAQRSPLSGFEL